MSCMSLSIIHMLKNSFWLTNIYFAAVPILLPYFLPATQYLSKAILKKIVSLRLRKWEFQVVLFHMSVNKWDFFRLKKIQHSEEKYLNSTDEQVTLNQLFFKTGHSQCQWANFKKISCFSLNPRKWKVGWGSNCCLLKFQGSKPILTHHLLIIPVICH